MMINSKWRRGAAALSVAVSAGFITTPAQGGIVQMPFALNLSPASAQALLSGVPGFNAPGGQLQSALPDIQLTTPYAVSISGIELTVNYAFGAPVPVAPASAGSSGAWGATWDLTSQSISAELVVGEINASQTIVEQLGGSTLTVTVQASCTDVHLSLPAGVTTASGQIQGSFGSNGKLTLSLQDFTANWVPSSWVVTSMNCQGPNGFGALVQQAAQAQLQTINPFLSSIQAQLQAQLNAASAQGVAWSLQGAQGITVTLQPTSIQSLPGPRTVIDGMAEFDFTLIPDDSNCTASLDPSTLGAETGSDDAIRIPLAGLEWLARCAYNNGSISSIWSSPQFPAFQAIVGSELESFIAWPDLGRFPSNSVFSFELLPMAAPNLSFTAGSAAGTLSVPLSQPVFLSIDYLAPTGVEPYVYFTSTLSGSATVSVANNAISIQPTLTGNLPLTAYWDPNYVAANHPNQRIWTSGIAGDLKTYLNGAPLEIPLPVWQVPGAFSLSASGAAVSGTDFRVSLGVTAQP